MRLRVTAVISFFLLVPHSGFGQPPPPPVVLPAGVVNGASFRPQAAPDSAVAAGLDVAYFTYLQAIASVAYTVE